ncbi:MAG: hypothetical protein ABSF03_00575 [Streptosporangiaceae bacterium]|jgi:hypothetical protein
MGFTHVLLHGHRRAGLAVAALALPGLLMASAASATASPVAATAVAGTARMTAATTQAGKPTTVQPSSSPGARTGAAIPAKPRGLRENAPVSTWTVTLTANPNLLWPTQYSTLTATASTDVGPTPYYLRIYDRTAGDYVVTCATGTTCSTPVTQPGQSTHYYVAVVSYASTGYPPSGEQAVSGDVGVVWHGVNLTLAASPTTVPVGAASTLTATTSQNIGLSPFWIEIFDVTTGTNVALCGSGTTCRATVSQGAATTQEYIAYLSDNSTVYPPPGVQETSLLSFITWSNLGWGVSLSAPAGTFGSETVTATANGEVGPSPYYIEIFNETGTRLATCGFGSTCSMPFTPSHGGSKLIAFISGYSTAFPPSGTVAASNVITSYLRIIR